MKKIDLNLSGNGVNIFGYALANMGLGQGMRLGARALQAAGLEVGVHPVSTHGLHVEDDLSIEDLIVSSSEFRFNLFYINADQTLHLYRDIPKEVVDTRYNIGIWAWELSIFPNAWLGAFDFVDEIWATSQFICDAISAKTDKPVKVIPYPVHGLDTGFLDRNHFGISPDKYSFLVTFDLNSLIARKNPIAAVNAFRSAFPASEKDVQLILKFHSGMGSFSKERERLLDIANADERIVVIDRVLSRLEIESLQYCCDVYVSLHRSEGFGFNIAECMRLGKPVIATNYSGSVDFMSVENSCPVPYTLIPLQDGDYPFWSGQSWAEPDVEIAADYMQKLYMDSEYRRQLGSKASERIRKDLSFKSVGLKMKTRLQEINRILDVN